MIELISADHCTGCNLCVRICPTAVFEPAAGNIPRIARQADCQTCFMCEAYCPEDALFVSPLAEETASVDERQLEQRGLLGSYRRSLGWGRERSSTAEFDDSYLLIARVG